MTVYAKVARPSWPFLVIIKVRDSLRDRSGRPALRDGLVYLSFPRDSPRQIPHRRTTSAEFHGLAIAGHSAVSGRPLAKRRAAAPSALGLSARFARARPPPGPRFAHRPRRRGVCRSCAGLDARHYQHVRRAADRRSHVLHPRRCRRAQLTYRFLLVILVVLPCTAFGKPLELDVARVRRTPG